jgi:uncharacterized protein (TIGR03382 family)
MQIRTAALAIAAAATAATADVYPLSVFENASNTSLAGLNLFVEVAPAGTGSDLIFRNESTANAVITAIYLESTPASQALIVNAAIQPQWPGVGFIAGATPPNPPGAIDAFGGPWQGNAFSMRATSPATFNGVSPGEWLTLRVDGSAASIQQALELGDFRIAQHVQGLGAGAEDSIWTTTTTIPAPATAALFLLAGAALHRRRR